MGHSDRKKIGVRRTGRTEAISIISQLIVGRVCFTFLQEKGLRGGWRFLFSDLLKMDVNFRPFLYTN
jgi:hypothetical protein